MAQHVVQPRGVRQRAAAGCPLPSSGSDGGGAAWQGVCCAERRRATAPAGPPVGACLRTCSSCSSSSGSCKLTRLLPVIGHNISFMDLEHCSMPCPANTHGSWLPNNISVWPCLVSKNFAKHICFHVYLMHHACAVKFDVTGNLEKFLKLSKA